MQNDLRNTHISHRHKQMIMVFFLYFFSKKVINSVARPSLFFYNLYSRGKKTHGSFSKITKRLLRSFFMIDLEWIKT